MYSTVGVLALQGAFEEHLSLLGRASQSIINDHQSDVHRKIEFRFLEVRTATELSSCDALVIPGGESTTISLVAARSNLLEPLREFVKIDRKPTWGTCAGLILLAESANRTKRGGQELIGGLDVRVNRNHFGRQIESFVTDVNLPFLEDSRVTNGNTVSPFPGIFIRAPIVEKILPYVEGEQKVEDQRQETVIAPSRPTLEPLARKALSKEVQVLGTLPGRDRRAGGKVVEGDADADAGDIIAVRQGNVFGTSFHPELTQDIRIHEWWLKEMVLQDQRLQQKFTTA